MPETIVDLGKKVKAKYPGQYDDIPDDEVGRKVKAKYPTEYADFADVAVKPAEDLGAIRKAQAAKFPSSQEQGKGGIGAEDAHPKVNAFMTELMGRLAPALDPRKLPENILSMFHSERGVLSDPEKLKQVQELDWSDPKKAMDQLLTVEGGADSKLVKDRNLPGVAGAMVAIPAAMAIGEAAGTMARTVTPIATGAGVPALNISKAPKPVDLTPTREQINSMSQVVRAGTRGNMAPQDVAAPFQTAARQAAQELGIDPTKDFVFKEKAPSADLKGDLYRGVTAQKHAEIARNLGKTSAQTRPAAIELADRAVDISHRPIQAVVEKFKDQSMPEVHAAILEDLATNPARIDAGVAKALDNLAAQLKKRGDTGKAINDFKVLANKETHRLFGKSPSAASAATATPVYAYQILGDSIRTHMYPALEKLAELPEDTLINAGRNEAMVIQGRDGVYANWANAAGEQSSRSLKSYITHIIKGEENMLLPASAKSYGIGMARRAINFANPLSQFNQFMRDGLGPIDISKLNTGTRKLIAQGSTPLNPPDTSSVTGTQAVTEPATREIRTGRTLGTGAQQMPAETETSLKGPSGIKVTQGAKLVRGYDDLISKAYKAEVTKGPAKGMMLDTIDLDPITGKPKKYIYIDHAGARKSFSLPQK